MHDRPDIGIADLACLDIAETGLRRRILGPAHALTEEELSKYDRTTLWYDAFWRDGRVVLITPRLLNLSSALRRAELRLDGSRARARRLWRFKRWELWAVAAPRPPRSLSIRIGGWQHDMAVAPAGPALFAGKNTIVTLSKNNDLRWIRDFALFHRKTQDAQAILFIDNGSERYTADDIVQALRPSGLSGLILRAPLPYGPVLKGSASRHKLKFFKTAILNVARLRFLSQARAVLNVDIDELVWSKTASVFDLAVRSRLGYQPFTGTWRLPNTGSPTHADHVWQDGSAPCPTKFAVVPRSFAGRFGWDVHRLEPFPLRHRLLREDVGYWHCSGISTGWKYTERLTRKGEEMDPEAHTLLARALGDDAP
ncbi:hypothetical protein C8N32_10858 [Rhodovulum imhoffii]|uniref:Glycosyl transferase family 2 n=1 Tax=Rhodovulum imhoffii TaxID=365340 RepID=A0A2T5BS10_9RHOB|nr:hypothetical protein [Rhodovulum imhoffii]MBK5933538.1 hypothetical protein [Rhodovulum imhoffii]PTN02107.1 hypothetical protein C8N32_10858 [Rhodovulum imhoffii]